jgi:demethylmenaquinone methyltransferase/2-methoxy-6-polyprenyl-1,4-benzoquinol methylase
MASTPDTFSNHAEGRGRQVRSIFSKIASRYDLLNHLLSLNVDRRWRRHAVDALGPFEEPNPYTVLDACAGTFDMSLELITRPGFCGRVMALDFALPMLVEGRTKLSTHAVSPVCGDSLQLPFTDAVFHSVMVAFGIRNLSDVDDGFQEFLRILRPGGKLVILEFTTPPNPLLRYLYLLYFHRILPVIGRLVSGHPWAYSYLPESVRGFPGPEPLAERLRTAGFQDVEWSYLTGGIAAIHLARRVG